MPPTPSLQQIDTADLIEGLDAGRLDAGPTLLEIARRHANDGDADSARAALRRLLAADSSYRLWMRAARLLADLRSRPGSIDGDVIRVSLIGTSTLDQLGELLPLAALAAGLDLDVKVAGFGQYESEALDASSELSAFEPDVVVLAPDTRSVDLPAVVDDADGIVDAALARWTRVWPALRANTSAQLLQLNLVPPRERPLGSLEAVRAGSRRQLFAELNRRLARAAIEADVAVVDAQAAAFELGLERWSDDRYWFHSKQSVSLGALPRLATEIAAVLGARLGRTRKVLVTDLDNTLWGGVVGDDGVAGIELSGTPAGEAHLAVQQHLRDLRDRGVLLAVCSKNDESTARAPFELRDDMILQLHDFAGFVANWSPKDQNLRTLAARLDLGLDSFVFVDDNPAERALIRQHLPQVDVIELPHDASGYRAALMEYRGFEPATVTAEDASRTAQYRARAEAHVLRASASSMEDYLVGLAMVAHVGPFDDLTLPRVAQLIGKTNQWNLTTRRHPPELLHAFMADPTTVTLRLRLEDRFADHGIVAVAIAKAIGDVLEIDTLLMSCRVIGRTVEHTMLDQLVSAAQERQISCLRGVYRSTDRNGLVADLYEQLGFDRVEQDDGGSVWELRLGEDPWVENPSIAVEEHP